MKPEQAAAWGDGANTPVDWNIITPYSVKLGSVGDDRASVKQPMTDYSANQFETTWWCAQARQPGCGAAGGRARATPSHVGGCLRWVTVSIAMASLLFAAGCVAVRPMPDIAEVPPVYESVDLPPVLHCEDAVRIALQNAPSVRAARERVAVRYWDKYRESIPPNPSLAASVIPSEWAIDLALAVDALLDLGGRRAQRVQAGQANEDAQVAAVLREEIRVAEAVRETFGDVLYLRRVSALLVLKRDALRDALQLAQGRLHAGDLAEISLLQLERQLSAMESALRDVDAEATLREAELKTSLRFPADVHLELVDSFRDLEFDGLVSGSDAVRLGVVRRPEIEIVLARIAEHNALLELAEVSWIPQIEGGPLIAKPGRDEDVTAGLKIASLTLPIFDWGQGLSEREEAELRALREELTLAHAMIVLDVHSAMIEWDRAAQRVRDEVPVRVRSAAREFEVSQRAFALGAMTPDDVVRARIDELDTQVELEQAHRSVWLAMARLKAAVGDVGREDESDGES